MRATRDRPREPEEESSQRGDLIRFPSAQLSDAALARALADGQPDAPRLAWQRFAPLVRRLLGRTLGGNAELDDHVQETFVRLCSAAPKLREPELLRSFLVGITMRVARLELRRRRLRRWLHLTESGVVPERASPPADIDARRALTELYRVLDQVDDTSRVVFVLRHVEGLELTEIAHALGTSLATTKRRLARASSRVLLFARKSPGLVGYVDPEGKDHV